MLHKGDFWAKQKIFLFLLVLVGVLFLFERIGLVSSAKGPFQRILLPAQIALYKTGQDIGNFLGTFVEIRSLRSKERDLELQNALLIAENSRLKNLEEENRILRDQIGAKKISKKLILSRVVGKDPFFTESRLLLDQGKLDGVEVGDLVIRKDILIGQIVSAENVTSVVKLLSDPETKIAASTERKVKGILEGNFGTGIIFGRVVQGSRIDKGDLIVSLGDLEVPPGFILGKVSQVHEQKAEPFKRAEIDPLIEYSRLDIVFVVKGSQ